MMCKSKSMLRSGFLFAVLCSCAAVWAQDEAYSSSEFAVNAGNDKPRIYIASADRFLQPGEEIRYYDAEWNELPSKRKATYYRVYRVGLNGEYEEIRDYFRSGSSQGYAEKAFFLSNSDDESIFGGRMQVFDSQGNETSSSVHPLFNYTNPERVREYSDASGHPLIGVWEVVVRNGSLKWEMEMLLWQEESTPQFHLSDLQSHFSYSLDPKSHYNDRAFILVDGTTRSAPFVFEAREFQTRMGSATISSSKVYPPVQAQPVSAAPPTGSPDVSIRMAQDPAPVNQIAVIGKASQHCDKRQDDGTGLAALIEGELLEFYRVVDRTHLEAILKEQQLALTGLVFDDAQFATAGCLAGAEATVIASYGCLNQNEQIQLKMVNCTTSDLIWSAIGLNVTELELMDSLRLRLRGE